MSETRVRAGTQYHFTLEAARELVSILEAAIPNAEADGSPIILKIEADPPHRPEAMRWRWTVAEAKAVLLDQRQQIARIEARGQPLSKTDVVTRDERGEIARVETLFHY